MLYDIYHVFVCFHLHLFALPISMKAHLINNIFSNRGYYFQLIYMLLMLGSYFIWRVDWVHSFRSFLDNHSWCFSMLISHLEKKLPVHRASALESWLCWRTEGKPFLSQNCALQCCENESTHSRLRQMTGVLIFFWSKQTHVIHENTYKELHRIKI